MADRQDNVRITVTVDGRALGVWEDRAGGASDATSVVYPLGGLGGRRALGGRTETDNVTVKRIFDDTARGYIGWLRGKRNKRMVVTETTIDDEGNVTGHSEQWTGLLKKVHVGDRDASGNNAETLELEMVCEGDVAVV